IGPTCHRDTESCFDRSDGSTSAEPTASELARLDGTIGERLRLLPEKS
ncbi:MAG: bifunctional phosphoribosyl-AMP cyclohydrolase/phosphoribosyl-ATP diphosphatase, partial [Lysobacterales bacterium CG_4_9_14_3_um_filter_62_6]